MSGSIRFGITPPELGEAEEEKEVVEEEKEKKE